jgi:hypothetical protein
MVADDRLIRRCVKCRFDLREVLPALDKKVIYLDQFAVSEICKIESGTRREGAPRRAFWEAAHTKIKSVVLLQKAIFPVSDVHLDETIVFKGGNELRRVYRRLSGNASLIDSEQVTLRQLSLFLEAYLNGEDAPAINFDVDNVLHGARNNWLPDIIAFANADYSLFADDIRTNRDLSSEALAEVAERWAREKKPFAVVLREELESLGPANKKALYEALGRCIAGLNGDNPMELVNAGLSPPFTQFRQVRARLEDIGVPEDQMIAEVFRFWDWPGLQDLPVHRISAYLYASLARKMSAGQLRPPSRGMFNDIRAISTYAPYVDAMFLDNECAALLSEEPLRSDLDLKATIFSLNAGDAFLDYLTSLEMETSQEVRRYAREIYGAAA